MSKRIDFLASLTKGYNTLLDIGSDHGLTIKKALEKKYIKNAIATDINPKSLNKAIKNLKGYPVDFIVTDGFKNIDNFYDLVIISGMGAYNISLILENSTKDVVYILQPNDKEEYLRNYLTNNNFKIIDEYVIEDNFFYPVIKCVKGKEVLSKEDIYLGPILKNKNERINFFKYKIKKFKKIHATSDKEKKQKLLLQIKILEDNIK